jgi:hypothetical protein
VIVPLILSVALDTFYGSPSPSPSPAATTDFYPEITHTRTSESCTTLRNLLTPVGFVTRRNDDAIKAMAVSVQKFLSGVDPADVPSLADVEAAQNGADVSTGADVSQVDQSTADDQLLYGPSSIIKAAEIDRVANEIYHNIVVEDDYMKQSWGAYPQGSDPQVDALRQRAQNLIDLQRGIADRYEDFARTYLNNQNMAQTWSPSEREYFKLYLRALLLGQAAALTQGDADAVDNDGYLSQSERARLGTVAEVVRGLHAEEASFAPAYLSTYNQCNGTHFTIVSPSPPPTPAPH